ncbi:uncharacterized protein LOC117078444 [Trachypithecus francoisi]|uniref:uncharacterized protein LOC117078444 n=1 Tax=Trachypithecus francoisi TaxID=54180 RepID=UPI00141BED6E|nr:uncharacterized protein LOC117078444 [Trachypithecus francoisi]
MVDSRNHRPKDLRQASSSRTKRPKVKSSGRLSQRRHQRQEDEDYRWYYATLPSKIQRRGSWGQSPEVREHWYFTPGPEPVARVALVGVQWVTRRGLGLGGNGRLTSSVGIRWLLTHIARSSGLGSGRRAPGEDPSSPYPRQWQGAGLRPGAAAPSRRPPGSAGQRTAGGSDDSGSRVPTPTHLGCVSFEEPLRAGRRAPGAGSGVLGAENLTRERAAPRAPASFPGRRRFRSLRPTCGTAARDPTDWGLLYHVQQGMGFKCHL